MLKTDKERLKRGADVLTEIEYRKYRPLKARLLRTIAEFDEFPQRFEGELEPLNELVDLGRKDEERFAQVLDVIDRHRLARTIVPTEEQRRRKAAYMKEYMRRYRAKQRQERVYPSVSDDIGADLDKVLKRKRKKKE